MIYKSSNKVMSCIRRMYDKANESKDEQQINLGEKEKMGK
jgi:hypothetical protein